MEPPTLPREVQYTQFWCEENVYLLARQFIQGLTFSRWKVFVVFISNVNKTVALWNQKLSKETQRPVIWDYHVILVLRSNLLIEDHSTRPVTSWVYDFDSRLGAPLTWTEYSLQTFPPELPMEFQSTFRIVSGEQFVDDFASDRSHMQLTSQAEGAELVYHSTPPAHPCICGPRSAGRGVTHNLTAFISMLPSTDGPGRIHTLASANAFFTSATNFAHGP
ncbi:hypothetical protein L218DRAFT_201057 [Marasmius fiardii PR-910]|nr:hypothetical protein L218DRAFT_201057 [Marasmius fiardii PR-910]